jgi:uncharacterized protein (TIGR02145 family)
MKRTGITLVVLLIMSSSFFLTKCKKDESGLVPKTVCINATQYFNSDSSMIDVSIKSEKGFKESEHLMTDNDTFDLEMISAVGTYQLFGTITDSLTNSPISNVQVCILNPDGSEQRVVAKSDSSGYYQFSVPPDREAIVKFVHSKYIEKILHPLPLTKNSLNLILKPKCPPYVGYKKRIYNTVQIRNQCWMKENLNYEVPNSYCYNDDLSYCEIYGRLYKWNAIIGTNGYVSTSGGVQGICPPGWHIPSHEEWSELAEYLGGGIGAGGKMKHTSYLYWNYPNTAATNSSGFSALGSGRLNSYGTYSELGESANFWTSTEIPGENQVRFRFLQHDGANLYIMNSWKNWAFSVRCLKD